MVLRWQGEQPVNSHDRTQPVRRLGRDDHAERSCQARRHVRRALGQCKIRATPASRVDDAGRAVPRRRVAALRDQSRYRLGTGRSPSYQQVPTDAQQLAAYQWVIDMLTGNRQLHRSHGEPASHRPVAVALWCVIAQPPAAPPRKLTEDINDFIARNEARQHVITAGLDRHEVAMNYNLLQVWDLLSLYICTNEVLKDQVIEPVPMAYTSPQASSPMQLKPLTATCIAVDPFPFTAPGAESPWSAGVSSRTICATQTHSEPPIPRGARNWRPSRWSMRHPIARSIRGPRCQRERTNALARAPP